MFGRRKEAIDHFTEALRINPDNELAHNNLAGALVRQGDLAKAIEHYADAIRLNPKSAEFHNNIGVALFENNDFFKSIKHYHSAIELNPRYAEAYNNLGNVLVKQGIFDEAIINYQKALEINRNRTPIQKNPTWARPVARKSWPVRSPMRIRIGASIINPIKKAIPTPIQVLNPSPRFNLIKA